MEVQTHVEKDEHVHPVEVAFAYDDPENPQEGWPLVKRWRVLAPALFVTYTSAFNATANGAASKGVRAEFGGVTASTFLTSSFTYLVMLGFGPLVLAPISESFGRRPMLVFLTGLITLLFLPQALAPNVASIIATRFFQGTAASVEGPVIAGIVADLFPKRIRGPAMGTFVLTVFTANATGPLCANWIAQELGWRWVYWIQMMMAGLCFALVVFFFPETRGDAILAKRAARMTKESGIPHHGKGTDRAESCGEILKISCLRPLLYLFTEPIVTALSLYVSFAWGMVFLFVGAIAHVFEETYGFSQGQGGTTLICGFIGAFIGWCTNFGQEAIYRRAVARGGGHAEPEVRLYSCAVSGILFGAACFMFGWTARSDIHWIIPCIAVVLVNLGIYPIYLATYNYIGDVYERYSSSGQAAQSLLRNILGAVFPFFGIAMYNSLGFDWASSLVGFIALALAIIPWILIFFGAWIRARSKIAQALAHEEGVVLKDEAQDTNSMA